MDHGKKKATTFRENVRRQFMMYTFMPLLLLMALLMAFFIYSSQNSIKKVTFRTADYVERRLKEELAAYQTFAVDLSGTANVKAYLAGTGKAQAIYEAYYDFNQGRGIKCCIHLVDPGGDIVLSSARFSKESQEAFDLFIFPRIKKNRKAFFWEMDVLRYPVNEQTAYLLSVPVETSGYLVLTLREQDFYQVLQSPDNEVCLIADAFENVLACNNRRFVSQYNKVIPELSGQGTTITLNGTNYVREKAVLEEFALQVYAANALSPAEELYQSMAVFGLIMVAAFSLLIWFFSHKIADRTSMSIETMIDAVSHTKNGELDFRVELHTNDEFQTLGEQFNKMQKRIELLLHNNEELMDLRRKAEVKQLESHFNPHFIFNVLESLRYSLYLDPEIAKQIIESLSRLLKYSLNTSKAENALSVDFRHLEEFLKLHKYRYGDKMGYQITLPEELEQVMLPKLILQPIVENSLKYGYRRRNAIAISIRAWEEGGWLLIDATDDGGGVSREKLKEIVADLHGAGMPGEHTGLYNSNRRLELMYGEGSGLTITSEEGESFTAVVRIPIRMRGDLG